MASTHTHSDLDLDPDTHSINSHSSNITFNEKTLENQQVNGLDASQSSRLEIEFGDKIDSHIPDGGWRAWTQVLGSWTAIVMTFGISAGSGILMSWLLENYLSDISPTRVGWMFSVQLFIFYILGVALGPIVDAVGVRVLIIPGSIGWVASMFILSACKKYYQFVLCYSILGGISSALLFNPSVTVLTHWFDRHRGLAIGIAASGSGVGGIVFSQILSHLLNTIGYGWAVRVQAFVVLFCALVTCLTLTSRHKSTSIDWNDAKPDIKALMEPSFLFCVIGLFFAEWGIFVPTQYIVSYSLSRGFSAQFGTNMVSYLSTASVVARIFTGYLSDKAGSFNMMIIFSTLSGIMCLAVWLPAGATRAGMVCFSVFFGIFSGAVISLTLITVPQLSNVKNAGRRYGTAYMIASFAVLTGIPIAGALTENHYLGTIIFSGVVYLAAAISFCISKYFAVGWKLVF